MNNNNNNNILNNNNSYNNSCDNKGKYCVSINAWWVKSSYGGYILSVLKVQLVWKILHLIN